MVDFLLFIPCGLIDKSTAVMYNLLKKEEEVIILFNVKYTAENIKRLRKLNNMTQSELAKRLFVSTQAVSKWENADSVPDIAKLYELSKIFDVSADSIINESVAEDIYIAVDGGGTKTEFACFAVDGRIRARITMGASNPNTVGIDKSCEVIKSGINTLVPGGTFPKGIYAGIAGLGNTRHSRHIEGFLKKLYPQAAIKCESDIFNVIGCYTQAERCMAAICGTGSAAFGYDGKNLYRAGGWGYLLADGGSGYGIGKDVLGAALAQRDGFGKATMLTAAVESTLGGTVWSSIDKIYAAGRDCIAAFAPHAFDAYDKHDKVAEEILLKHAKYIAELLNFLNKQYDCGDTAVIAGGLMNRQDIMLPAIQKYLTAPIEIFVPKVPQIYGACVQCCRFCGIDFKMLEEQFD